MIRPRKMKQVELTVLKWDVDRVLEFLGRRAIIHFSEEGDSANEGPLQAIDTEAYKKIQAQLEKIKTAAAYLGVDLPEEPAENTGLPGEAEEKSLAVIVSRVEGLSKSEHDEEQEKRRVEEALGEAKAFANLNAPFSDLDQLSYLTLRVGRLDPKKQAALKESLSDRAVVIPLDNGDRVLAAASRKGRFALDSELKKQSFVPITVPEGYKGVPAELLSGLESRLETVERDLKKIQTDKAALKQEYGQAIGGLAASYIMASTVEQLKGHFRSTNSAYVLAGWVPADSVDTLVADLENLTQGRIAVLAYNPEEVEEVREGKEKVPVSLDHGAFVKGFEGVVFSYGAPLYGTIDPTPFVAFFFTILFGIMFGDLGQGFVLFLLGLLTGKHGLPVLRRFKKYSTPLIAVGIASMVMGLLDGEVFANENILIRPTRFVTEALTGKPMDRILHLMPEKGSIDKLFYFFGFTIAVGIVLNSIGLIINIINQCTLKKYEKAFFSKTGLAGALFFWYAIFIAVRIILGGRFVTYDLIGLILPVAVIFFGPAIWRLISGERPVMEHGFLVFVMEGFVEVLETASTYISNTVSFLRVGAFALSHAVLSFIVFSLSDMVSHIAGGPVFSLIVMIIGNAVIILLEGMIVAIQVVRLQYYEFFSKFFTEAGVEYKPFRFRKEVQ
ncbi:V-type ATP synthase subunit I [Breznakiella homolactica]|uniref:V-type ATP synthase subunit I n=1 Tax=Breznakiella homolactica TaxID=2798577 RepID=A0A7T8BCA5_9SPIR|nr:V-type ATPase 116kDa subunit family protein [Breznakiella homolactica]QQO11226.1 V-type ATP synthase subunit I [Breznakiella homolactica]